VHNYRSTDAIVAISEAALGPASGVERDAPRAVRPAQRAATLVAFDDDAQEATRIAEACWHEFTMGVPWDQMAILFRTNAQSSLFETALSRRGVPFCVTGAQRFSARPAVRVLLERMRDAERSAPGHSFAEHLADLAADVDAGPDADDADNTRAATGVTDPPDNDEVRTHRDALLRLGRDYAAAEGGGGSVAGFSAWLEYATRREDAATPGVDLVTFHRAKGLEWQVVFVTGLERGLVPISWAATPEARAEERRLLHVALGRAEDWLHCSWARERTAHGRRSVRQPSPWLADLEQAIAARPVVVPDPRVRIGDARTALGHTKPPAPTSHARRRARQ
jgi:DNA helicase-2/ATP-dependent DNA helicase PcrA